MRPVLPHRVRALPRVIARALRSHRRSFAASIVVLVVVLALAASVLTIATAPAGLTGAPTVTVATTQAPASQPSSAPSTPAAPATKDAPAPAPVAPAPAAGKDAPSTTPPLAAKPRPTPKPVKAAKPNAAAKHKATGTPVVPAAACAKVPVGTSAAANLAQRAAELFSHGQQITRAELRPGDLVFANQFEPGALYLGNNTVVYAADKSVCTAPLPTGTVSGYVRVTNPGDATTHSPAKAVTQQPTTRPAPHHATSAPTPPRHQVPPTAQHESRCRHVTAVSVDITTAHPPECHLEHGGRQAVVAPRHDQSGTGALAKIKAAAGQLLGHASGHAPASESHHHG
jgi:hypothetical protein